MFEKDRRAAATELKLHRDHFMTFDEERHVLLFATPEAKALYSVNQGFAEPANCVVCLRAYDAQKAHSGGSERIHCTVQCRQRADDARRRALPTEWRKCPECGTGFLCLTTGGKGRKRPDGTWTNSKGKVLCPPPWPAAYWDQSPCWNARKRRVARQSMRRHRLRQPDNDGLLALTIYRQIEVEHFVPEWVAKQRSTTVEAIENVVRTVNEWLEHARTCEERRGCPHVAHRHIRTINRLIDEVHDAQANRPWRPPAEETRAA